jgi:hypothetical protein
LLILGSLHAFAQDRRLDRSEVRSLQVILDGEAHHAPFFDAWGEWGVVSFALASGTAYVATGTELLEVDLIERRARDLGVPDLHDVHELTLMGRILWIANTGRDELVAFDVDLERVAGRVQLSAYGSVPRVVSRPVENDGSDRQLAVDVREESEKFHCNQVLKGFDGHHYALVHYALGESQLIRRAARRLMGRQGNGGVIDLDDGRVVPLGLMGPHTLRKVDGHYRVCDSGRSTVNVYDGGWNLKGKIPSQGWVRGADVSERLGIYYVGISQFRRRYMALNPTARQTSNMVQAISVETGKPVGELTLSGVERVTNVYVVPRVVAASLLELR